MNVGIYVDYDNLYKRLKAIGHHPISDLDFFTSLKNKFNDKSYNIVRFMAFADFMGNGLSIRDQTAIHTFGLDVLHCNVSNKNTTDAEFMLQVTKDLYEMNNIDIFVLVSNDRDYVPLMRLIKEKSKQVFVLTTEKATNKVVNVFADYHQYIEDLFNLKDDPEATEIPEKDATEEITLEDQEKAGLVARKFYESGAYGKLKSGSTVSLDGYATNLAKAKAVGMSSKQIKKYLMIAHGLNFIKIVERKSIYYIEEGELYKEISHKKVATFKET